MNKRLLLVSLLLLLGSWADAQVYQWSVPMGYGAFYHSEIATDDAGNLYKCGAFRDSIHYTATNAPGVLHTPDSNHIDAVLMKFDPVGNLIWSKVWGGIGNDFLYDIEVDAAQNIVLIGYFESQVDLDPGPNIVLSPPTTGPGAGRYYIIKLDPNGNLLWYHVNPSNYSHGLSIEVDPSDNIVVAGRFIGQMDADPDSTQIHMLTAPNTGQGVFVLKLTPQGDFIWALANDGDQFLRYEIQIDQQGYTNLSGSLEGQEVWFGSVGSPLAHHTSNGQVGTQRSYLQRIDPSGGTVFSHLWEGYSKNEMESTVSDSAGNTYCIGNYIHQIDLDPSPGTTLSELSHDQGFNPHAFYLLKFSPAGHLVWGKSILSKKKVFSYEITLTEAEMILFCGEVEDSTDFDPGPLAYWRKPDENHMFFVAGMDPDGELLDVWTTQSNSSSISLWDAEYVAGEGFYFCGMAGIGIDLDPGAGVSDNSLSGNQNVLQFIAKWDVQANVNPFRALVNNLVPPLCQTPGQASWESVNGVPPIHYYWNGDSVGTDTSTLLYEGGLYTLSAVDSVGQTFTHHYQVAGPGSFNDVDFRANMIPRSLRPGFSETLTIDVSNLGCESASGEIFMVVDSLTPFQSSTPSPNRTSTDTLFWSISQWNYDSGKVEIGVVVLPDVQSVGDEEVCYSVGVMIQEGDLDSTNNLLFHCQQLVNSYDPNDIRVFPRGACKERLILPDQMLTYAIRFQNTGTAPAINIEIRDTLPVEMDLSTFQVLSHSHSGLVTELGPGNKLRFIHQGIMLPDSNANEPESHGYILFQIQALPEIAAGVRLSNQAAIYFDFNPPIFTNSVWNTTAYEIPECFTPSETGKGRLDQLTLFPNPGKGQFFLEAEDGYEIPPATMEIYAATGQLLWYEKVGGFQLHEIKLAQPSGMYFLRVTTDSESRTWRMVNLRE